VTIAETTIQLVRQRTDLAALVGETVKLMRRGRSWLGLCPFHKEKTPSFHVTPERGIFHCFGCGEHGNAITFVMKVEGLTFPEAVRRLAERAGLEVEETGTDRERREEASRRKARDDLYGLGNLAAVYFEKMLREHPQAQIARDELERRGLVAQSPTDSVATALGAFRVGYAPAGWDGLTTFFREQGVSPLPAEQVGLLVSRQQGAGHYDRFRHRLMFAVVDAQGRVVAFSGRVLPDPRTGEVDRETGKYINSPESPIYRKGETVFGLFQARQALREQQEAVVVEGNFDVVSLHARGINNVVAPLGTAFTAEQATLIKRFAPTAVLLFDGDAAGRKATRAAREPCKKAGLSVKVATLPTGKDPDDLAREKGPVAVQNVIRAARNLLEYLITSALDESFVRADAAERAVRVREVAELLRSEDDPMVRDMAKSYVDTIVGHMSLTGPQLGSSGVDQATFRSMSQEIEQALRGPTQLSQPHGSHGSPSHSQGAHGSSSQGPPWAQGQRDPSRPAFEGPEGGAPPPRPKDVGAFRPERLNEAILGALLDFPTLLNEQEVCDAVGHLNGDAALAVAAIRRKVVKDPDLGLDAEEILAHLPPSFHAFARRRLAAPFHDEPARAREELLLTAEKVRKRALTQENRLDARESARVQASGDDDEAFALLRDISERARQKRRQTPPGGAGPVLASERVGYRANTVLLTR
jgi:DNA primase